MTDEFDDFAHTMWSDNCMERDAYGEKLLKKQEYIEINKEFLLEQFWLSWGEGKKWIDGEWKSA